MEYKSLGRTGVQVSPLVLGTDNFANPTPSKEASDMINLCLDSGINLIDTSNSYAKGESESIIGQSLKESGRRNEVILATKAHYPTGPGPNDWGNSRLHLIRACEDSLRRLKTDHIDLYQIHRPSFDIPQDETLSALTDLVRQGKIRYIGSSTAPAWKIMEGLMISELNGFSRFVSEQSPYNLLDRRIENEVIPMCQAHGIGLLTWSPLAMGLLTGRYNSPERLPTDSRAVLRGGIYAERITGHAIQKGLAFFNLAQKYGLDPVVLALRWIMDQKGITAPIIGPRTISQLKIMLTVLEIELSQEIREECDILVPPGTHAANFLNTSGWHK